jgi:hypothetical protein
LTKIEKYIIGLKLSASSETYNGMVFRKNSKISQLKFFGDLENFDFFSKNRKIFFSQNIQNRPKRVIWDNL